MKCTTCGYETQPGARFCVQCGTTLPAEPVPVAQTAEAGPPQVSFTNLDKVFWPAEGFTKGDLIG